ncbi:mitogen-activated protein kinase kinase kinase 4-like [Artemia franciscana]|uniref:mitogen-activated protein kinase kinase kinase 4-like n=1 Tax=Artemia franciscana TaxID=6661 RepID=UPI0032DBA198
MAPEVFMSTAESGHGRAADIWSVGCVVVEMTTGKRPLPELESNYAIMFRVGMGEHPEPSVNLSAEGKDFIGHGLTHDQYERWTALQLLEHQFVKNWETASDFSTTYFSKTDKSFTYLNLSS